MTTPKYVQAAYRRIGAAESRLFRFDGLFQTGAMAVEAKVSEAGDDAAEAFAPVAASELVFPDLRRRAKETWRARRECETAFGAILGPEFLALDIAVGISQECTRRLSNSHNQNVPPQVAYAFSSLAVRAHATVHEISALLRAGMVNGARGRWRTLHEIDVVTRVLAEGNRHTATRYNNHRWVTLALDIDHAPSEMSWPFPGPDPATMRMRLIKRYGDPYGSRYGWAAEVSKRLLSNPRPNWYHLEKIADISAARTQRVKTAHHAVHADALVVLRHIDATGLLHAGAQVDGVADVAWQAIHTLRGTTNVLLGIWQRYDQAPQVTAGQRFADEVLFQCEVIVLDRIAEERALAARG